MSEINNDNTEIVPQIKNKKLRGFAAHPENINRKGTPKREDQWFTLFKLRGEELDPKTKRPSRVELVNMVYLEALKGNLKAAQIIFDRTEGRPMQQTDLTTNGKDIPAGALVTFIQEARNAESKVNSDSN
jgi:hypothetical protein